MKKRFYISLLFFTLLSNVSFAQKIDEDWADFRHYAMNNSELQFNGVRPKAVFMGDSITDYWLYHDRSFFIDNNYVNRGISGQTSSQMLVRFRADVIDLNPKYVVILAGTNDIARNNGFISIENILDNIISMCELAKAHKIKPVICSVPPAVQFSWRKDLGNPTDSILALNDLLRKYARNNKIPYVDYYSALSDDSNALKYGNNGDTVHPGTEGYIIMESLVHKVLK